MAGLQGPSERRSRPRLREKGPAAKAVGKIAPTGRTAPKAPAGDIEYVNLTKKSRPEIRGGFIRMSLKQKVLYGEFRVN